jgi:hypothetical protein
VCRVLQMLMPKQQKKRRKQKRPGFISRRAVDPMSVLLRCLLFWCATPPF